MALPWRMVIESAGFLTAPFLLVGLWTPVAGGVQSLLSVAGALWPGGADRQYLFDALFGASLALLGPGAWSIDARLFGRKQISVIGPRPDPE